MEGEQIQTYQDLRRDTTNKNNKYEFCPVEEKRETKELTWTRPVQN